MKPVKLFYDGSCYGEVLTSVAPTMEEFGRAGIWLCDLQMEPAATLAADLLGEAQPYTRHEVVNLARWVLRFGIEKFEKRPFLAATARALIWRPNEIKY